MANSVVQWQIVTRDPEKVATFYSKLFEWKVDANNALAYRAIRTGNGGIDGGVWPAPSRWAARILRSFVACAPQDDGWLGDLLSRKTGAWIALSDRGGKAHGTANKG